MGADRSSIHKPDYCLPGQGWQIVEKSEIKLNIGGPQPYQLPVAKWVIRNFDKAPDGSKREVSGLYVFWFAADNELTASHNQRIQWQTRDLLLKGVLQRWAYISYFTMCSPGQEDATFERVSQLITASVPEFQHPPKAVTASTVAQR
jgi:hypothetical protein